MKINFDESSGLVPAVVQDEDSGEVLMLAYINEQAWNATLTSGFATFWSRSRGSLWLKGATSGHKLVVREVLIDCDLDAIVLKVKPIGSGVCHNGFRSCFYRKLVKGDWKVTDTAAFDPTEVYS